MKISNILAKTVGAAGIGLLTYDAHTCAKDNSKMYSTRRKTDKIESLYYDTLNLSHPSRLKDSAKKTVLNLEMDSNVDTVFYKISGYVKSIGHYIVEHTIPIGLSAAALLTKGLVSKASAIGLAAYTITDFIGEFKNRK